MVICITAVYGKIEFEYIICGRFKICIFELINIISILTVYRH